METLKMVWRTALFLGAVTVVFVLYTVGVALVERHFSPKYAKKLIKAFITKFLKGLIK